MRTSFEPVGDVREVDLLAAFVDLWRRKAAGLVSFSRAGASAAFALSDGDVVTVSSSESRFESSAILVRAGKLDAAALERLSVAETADGALAALQAGILTKREWRWGEKIRGIEVLTDLLSWPDGKYYFDADARPAPGEFTVAIPRLLLELFLRSRDRNLIEHQLGPSDTTLVRSDDFDSEFATFGLTADAESVVRMIDGKATADEIARGAPADEFAVRKLLAALMTLGLLRSARGARGQASPDDAGLETVALAGRETEPERFEDSSRPEDLPAAAETGAAEDFDAGTETPEGASEDGGGKNVEPVFPALVLPSAPAPPQASEFDLDPTPPSSLEAFPLPGAGSPGRDEPGSRDAPAGGLFEPLRPSEDAAGGAGERPARAGGVAPLVWVIVGLAALTGAVLFLRSRSSPPGAAPEPSRAAVVTSAAAVTSAAPTLAPVAALAPTFAPAPAATSVPPRATAVPAPTKGRPASRSRTAAALPTAARAVTAKSTPRVAAPVPATAAASAPGNRAEWLARAARDRARLKSERGTRYAVQLELACEVPSLAEAWKHDRPAGSMWLLASRHGPQDCFRVLWGRYRNLEAARKAKPGIPAFFSTASNHPAIVSVP
ncbi:MAG: DUF4388 domain-containing protein [Acidobacteriota bacterium]